jgi:ethanolamine utilization protein EutN
MQIARVLGNLVSSHKHEALENQRLLLVQPCDLSGEPRGSTTMAVDVVDAGVGDWVLVLDEGSSASQVLERPRGPVRTLVVGVIDELHLAEGLSEPGRARQSKQRQGVDRP